jgi:hypothetical protein
MHRGGTVTVDRKTGDKKTIFVPNALVSVCGTIQPGTLRRVLRQEHIENGLAPRILFARPPEHRKQWSDATVSAGATEALDNVLGRLLELRHNTGDGGGPEPVNVPLSADGKTAWVSWYNWFAGQQHGTHQAALRAALAKLEAYAARFALVFHLVRWAASDLSLRNPDRIDAQSVEAGATLAEWFAGEAERVYSELGENETDREHRELAEFIRCRGGAITVRELQRGPRRFRGDADEARAALDGLVKAGFGTWDRPAPGDGGGRPADVFRLRSDGGDTGDGDKTLDSSSQARVVSPSPLSPVQTHGIPSVEGGDFWDA